MAKSFLKKVKIHVMRQMTKKKVQTSISFFLPFFIRSIGLVFSAFVPFNFACIVIWQKITKWQKSKKFVEKTYGKNDKKGRMTIKTRTKQLKTKRANDNWFWHSRQIGEKKERMTIDDKMSQCQIVLKKGQKHFRQMTIQAKRKEM